MQGALYNCLEFNLTIMAIHKPTIETKQKVKEELVEESDIFIVEVPISTKMERW